MELNYTHFYYHFAVFSRRVLRDVRIRFNDSLLRDIGIKFRHRRHNKAQLFPRCFLRTYLHGPLTCGYKRGSSLFCRATSRRGKAAVFFFSERIMRTQQKYELQWKFSSTTCTAHHVYATCVFLLSFFWYKPGSYCKKKSPWVYFFCIFATHSEFN